MKKKLIVTLVAEVELNEDWYDEPFSILTDEQIIETEKDQVKEWFWDYLKIEDYKIINYKEGI